ncbi:uncharacterized protein LOC124940696 [Impatiens glandulifera]|uniref:uncharacterized protein LOC124940696 n=1 Tax=Impatiens glandulifera TaxID=253017 RepID=UPI001FB0F86D|nr:uncharacterized protein LOC124940696 [Impatiens glandulifera]
MEKEEDYNQKVQQQDEDDEEEETLSFCDLPIYSNNTDDYSVSVSSSSLDDDEMNMFEFLNRDMSIGSSEKSIIFCGKIITYKESEQFNETDAREESKPSKGRRYWSLFREKSSKDRTSTSVWKLPSSVVVSSRSTRSRSRSRWNLIMFGLLKFPSWSSGVEMELSDIRNRQKRRNPAKAVADGEEKRNSSVNGLWSLIRTLSCSSGLAVSAVVPGTGFLY